MQARKFIFHKAGIGLVLTLALAGCEGFPTPIAPSASAGAATGAAPERDVVRSDLFSVTEAAMWDGRPTFGGVWVAYTGDIQPERVRITNRDNGKTVIGALFRRERETPGPAIQLSADAASALNVVAGTSVQLTVTALRREATPEVAPAPEPAAAETPASTPAAHDETAAEARPVSRPAAAAAAAPATISEAPIAAAPATAPAAAPEGAPSRPYAQVGTFASQSNANDLVTILGTNGVTAGVRQVEVDGRTLYRVIAGPAESAASLAALIAKLKELGYSDAFPIR